MRTCSFFAVLALLYLTACDDKKTDAKTSTASAASGHAAPAPAKTASPGGGW